MNDQSFYSLEYGKIHKHILKICKDRFICDSCTIGRGDEKKRRFTFDKDTVTKVGKTFDVKTNIEILKEEGSQDVYDNDTDKEIWKDWEGVILVLKTKSGYAGSLIGLFLEYKGVL